MQTTVSMDREFETGSSKQFRGSFDGGGTPLQERSTAADVGLFGVVFSNDNNSQGLHKMDKPCVQWGSVSSGSIETAMSTVQGILQTGGVQQHGFLLLLDIQVRMETLLWVPPEVLWVT